MILCISLLTVFGVAVPPTPTATGPAGQHAVWRLQIPSVNATNLHSWLSKDLELDVWRNLRNENKSTATADISIPAAKQPAVAKHLASIGAKWTVMIDDLDALIAAQFEDMAAAAEADTAASLNTSRYHPMEDIYPYLDSIPTNYPLATKVVVGKSVLGRDITAIKISRNDNTRKPALWMDGGLHAREWITPAVMLWMLEHFLENADSDPEITVLLNAADIYFLPVANPDGYEYTWNFVRTWRKNRRINGGNCFGVDLNRNFDFEWNAPGHSKDPCSDLYRGPFAFSEPEPQAIADFIGANQDIRGYINFHAYSQLWMSPWGYSYDAPKDINAMRESSDRIVRAIEAVHGTAFQYGEISRIIYQSSGSSVDYMYGVHGLVQSYGPELRDTGRYGFMLPEDQIVPSSEEILAAVKVMVSEIVRAWEQEQKQEKAPTENNVEGTVI